VPNHAILIVFLGTAILVLFPLASTIALNVITSSNLAVLLMAYLICICVLVDARIRAPSADDIDMDDRHFPLPMWMVWIANVVAIAFLVLVIVMLAFPAAPHPTAASMNWTCVLLPVMVVFALGWYYLLGGKKNYVGPVDKLKIYR
jgi:choline transport protein